MTKVFDVFMFNDELDILECRFTELENTDVTHILIEATLNLQGKPKPLYYADNKSRFSKWSDKVTHIIVDDLDPHDNTAWGRDHAQRENGFRGLADADPYDVVIHSDCDEILREDAIEVAHSIEDGGYRFRLKHYIFACDWEIIGGEDWNKPAATLMKNIHSITALRRSSNFHILSDMGWHLSFFGGPEGIARKMEGDCHPEVRAEVLQMANAGMCYEKGMIWQDPKQATPVDVDETWPRYIREGRAPAIWFRPRDIS